MDINALLMEALKAGGPVVLLIVLGYFERKSILDRHYKVMESFIGVVTQHGESLREVITLLRERLK